MELARRARDAVRPDALVAASVGPYGVKFANGTEYTGDYRMVADGEFAELHRPRIAALLAAGPDLLASRRSRRSARSPRSPSCWPSSPAPRRG